MSCSSCNCVCVCARARRCVWEIGGRMCAPLQTETFLSFRCCAAVRVVLCITTTTDVCTGWRVRIASTSWLARPLWFSTRLRQERYVSSTTTRTKCVCDWNSSSEVCTSVNMFIDQWEPGQCQESAVICDVQTLTGS